MQLSEKKEIRMLLRDNRLQRQQLKKRREEIKSDGIKLREERKLLMEKAEKLGVKFGKKKAASA